jgi:ubiquitin-conjugating enzyme E2 Z
MTSSTISSSTVNRLISDIKEVVNGSLSKDGIYYKHNEENMLVGYALIIGPSETPYAYGNFLFKLEFPHDYPHRPPTVTYHTNDGYTRFNPNLYKNGKVCISLLNTWKGEQWTSCQTIRLILLTLCSILNKNPLVNEPGITEVHPDIEKYNKIIKYRTLDSAIHKIITGEFLADDFKIFKEEINNNFIKNYNKIISDINNKSNEYIICGIYNLSVSTHYNRLKREVEKQYNILNKQK